MTTVDTDHVLSPIRREDCLALLESQEVGRLAVVDGGQPFVFPVNYAMAGEAPVFRSADGTKMRAGEGRPVCFEVDELDAGRQTGWSVMVIGWLEEVNRYHPSLFDAMEALGVTPWAAGDRPHLLRVAPRRVTGRRISVP
jgi:nitroimidazol reductase NimA-like FMN-containing flavoprotein (pyridoxamine 5'-phosphate oxidase superfamily)